MWKSYQRLKRQKLKQNFTKKLQKNVQKKSSIWRKVAVAIVVCLAFSGGTLYGKQFLTKKEELSSISGAYRLNENNGRLQRFFWGNV